MNRVYRTVFNKHLGQFQVAAETSRTPRGTGAAPLRLTPLTASLLLALGLAATPAAALNYTNNGVVAGSNGTTGSGGIGGAGGNAGLGAGVGGTGGNGGTGGVFANGTAGSAGSGGGQGGQLAGVNGGVTGGGGAGGYSNIVGATGGGGGGGGGSGIVAVGTSTIVNAAGLNSIVGGNGANGETLNGVIGSGGGGGNGITLVAASGSTITNVDGYITGGNGGGGSISAGAGGSGGDGIYLQGSNSTITNGGTISGGSAAYRGLSNGNAVTLIGDDNRVVLLQGGMFSGNVVANGTGNVFELGSASSGTFDSSTLGSQYQGFDSLEVSGIWTLSGISTYSGDILISSGGRLTTSVASLGSSDIVNNYILVLDQSTDATLTNSISGSGILYKTNSGKLVLESNSSAAAGTSVSGGALIIGGSAGSSASLTSNVVVFGSAMIGGHGTLIGNILLANPASILAPGNSIGTLHVTGNVNLDSGILEIEANPDGTSDQLIATGSVNLGTSTLRVLAGSGTWQPSTSYSIIQAGSLAGSFASITSNLAFLTPTVSYSTTEVSLTLARNDTAYAALAHSDNQRAVAISLGNTVSGSLVTAITGLGTDEVGAAFDSLSGELHASARSALFDDSRQLRDAISERLRGAGETAILQRDAASGLTFWLKSYGSWAETDGNHNAAKLERDSRGTFIGADLPLNDTWRAGAALGYGSSDLDVNHRGSSADVDSSSVAAYLGGQWDAVNLRLGLGRTWNQVDSKRNVQVGNLDETVKAGYDATTTQVFGELGYALQLQELALEPYVGLAHVEVDSEGFREHGGSTALRGDSEKDRIDYASLGLRASAPLGQLAGRPLSLQSALAWQHAFDQPKGKSRLALNGFDSFTVEGVPVAEDSALLRVSLGLQLAPQASVELGYAGQLSDDSRDHGVRLGVAIAW